MLEVVYRHSLSKFILLGRGYMTHVTLIASVIVNVQLLPIVKLQYYSILRNEWKNHVSISLLGG